MEATHFFDEIQHSCRNIKIIPTQNMCRRKKNRCKLKKFHQNDFWKVKAANVLRIVNKSKAICRGTLKTMELKRLKNM